MRTAIIGASHWHAPRHAASFRAAGCELVAASDPNPAALEAFCRAEGLIAYSDYRRLLEQEKLEFAIIMGTPLEMPDYALAALEAKLPFSIEKPVAVSAKALEPIVAAAQGRFVSVALANRYSGLWEALGALERTGQSGQRYHASFRLLNGFPERYRRDGVDWVLEPQISGGGALRNLGIHGMDAFLEFAGDSQVNIEYVQFGPNLHGSAVEEHALIALRAANGITGTLEAGYTYPTLKDGGDYEWRLCSQNGYLLERHVPGSGTTLHAQVLHQAFGSLETIDLSERYAAFAADTIARFKAGRAPRASFEDLQRAMRLIDEAYELARRRS